MENYQSLIKKVLALSFFAFTTNLSMPVFAATDTANIQVSATVLKSCEITATPIAFGNYDPTSVSTHVATGTVSIACTKGSAGVWIGLDNGTHFAAGTRNMNGGGADNLAYTIVQPSSATPGAGCPAYGTNTAWGNTIGTSPAFATPTSAAIRTFNVCGQLAGSQDVSVATYTDTVIATVNF